MSARYEMYIRVKTDTRQRWLYFDESKTIEELVKYDKYKNNPLYDAKIVEVTTTKKTIKDSTGE